MSDPVIVRMKHVRAALQCSRGTRAFFARHNLDYPDFLINGVGSDVLEATGDEMARSAITEARREAEGLSDGR